MYENITKEEIIRKRCKEYGIAEHIPYNYLSVMEKGSGTYYYDAMCGTGKTIGLAIALASEPRFNICYCASNNARLYDFGELLDKFGVSYVHIKKSTDVMNCSDYGTRNILMTTSMLIQIPAMYLNTQSGNDEGSRRVLVIDELPKIINPITYSITSLLSLKETLQKLNSELGLVYSLNRIPRNEYTKALIYKMFRKGEIRVLNDLAINKEKYAENELQENFDLDAKAFFIDFLLSSVETKSSFEYTREEIRFQDDRRVVMSLNEIYLKRFSKTLILDATADLYGQLFNFDRLCELKSDEKNYSDFVRDVYDLSTYSSILEEFLEKDKRNFNFLEMFALIKGLIDKCTEKGDVYLVTNNDSLYYYEEGSNWVHDEVLDYFKNNYETVEVNSNKDFIKLRNWNNCIYIANYNRNRGTNLFRDCEYVFLIGEFKLPLSDITQMATRTEIPRTAKEIQFALSVGDAIQEVSRGVLRTRRKDLNEFDFYSTDKKKETIFLFGSPEWKSAISDYLGVPLKEFEQDNINALKYKLLQYRMDNKDNLRKASYIHLVDLILKDSEWSPVGKVSRFEIEEAVKNEDLPAWILYKNSRLKEFFEKLEIKEISVEKCLI